MISLSILKGTQTVILYITVNFSRSVKGKPARIPGTDSGNPYSFSMCLLSASFLDIPFSPHLQFLLFLPGKFSFHLQIFENNQAAIFDLMLAANPDTAKVGLLYDKSQASSLGAIEDAKAYCDEKGIAYVEKTGTTSAEVQAAADALVAEGVDAVFTPQDNTVMTAELAIFEKFIDAGIPHYTGADSFALNGAFCGYGVNYEELGTKTADMAVDILVNGADPAATPIETLERGIVTVNTETAEALGLDYSMFKDMCSEVIETVTAEEFE